jgi:hypothetical protein
MLTGGGEGREQPESGRRRSWRPARASMCGGAAAAGARQGSGGELGRGAWEARSRLYRGRRAWAPSRGAHVKKAAAVIAVVAGWAPLGLTGQSGLGRAGSGLRAQPRMERRSFFNFQKSFSRAKINLKKSRQFI